MPTAAASWLALYTGLLAVLVGVHRTQPADDRLDRSTFAILTGLTVSVPIAAYAAIANSTERNPFFELFPLLYGAVGVVIGILGAVGYLVIVRDASGQRPESPLE